MGLDTRYGRLDEQHYTLVNMEQEDRIATIFFTLLCYTIFYLAEFC